MAQTDFFKVYGAEVRNDRLITLGSRKHILIFGYGTDGEQGYSWRKVYDHRPTEQELRNDINTLVNSLVDDTILRGFSWNGKPVWLSQENQLNFKAAYDLAVQTEGATLPIKFKLGERDGEPVYHTFTTLSAFTDFFTKAVQHVIGSINAGWVEKDGTDIAKLLEE